MKRLLHNIYEMTLEFARMNIYVNIHNPHTQLCNQIKVERSLVANSWLAFVELNFS